MKEMEKVALKPDHKLMDPDFEGYKLSLDSVPVHHTKLDSSLEVRNHSDDQVIFYSRCTFKVKLLKSLKRLQIFMIYD